MGRPKNTVQNEELRLAVAPTVKDALEKLAATGLFGSNPNEVAIRLISDGLQELATRALETQETLSKLGSRRKKT